MINVNTLYPVVHDLTDIESVEQPHGCCHDSILGVSPGCFSLKDLVNPQFSSIPWSPTPVDEEFNEMISKQQKYFGRQATFQIPYPISLVVDDRNDSIRSDDRRMKFDEVYVLTREVHKGKRSTVWECVHRATGIRYAAKVVDRRKLGLRDDHMILCEYLMLKHVHKAPSGIAKLVDFFEEQTHFNIVMEFANGGDLLTTLAKKGKLSEEDSKQLAKSLLKGIDYLHKNGICHRNLKPENLLLKDSQDASSVMIADFGMASRMSRDSGGNIVQLTARCGTSSYVAPEVIQQVPYDTQVDMWSLGVIVYYVLTGSLPFNDVSRRDLFSKITKCQYRFHPADWLGISKSAKRFISNLLHVDPEVRLDPQEALHHSWLAEMEPQIAPEHITPKTTNKTLKLKLSTMNKSRGKKLMGVWKSCSPGSRKRRSTDIEDSKSILSAVTSDATNESDSPHISPR